MDVDVVETVLKANAVSLVPVPPALRELDVRRLSFTEFLNTLLARFSGAQPVGYLLITSMPASSGITIAIRISQSCARYPIRHGASSPPVNANEKMPL